MLGVLPGVRRHQRFRHRDRGHQELGDHQGHQTHRDDPPGHRDRRRHQGRRDVHLDHRDRLDGWAFDREWGVRHQDPPERRDVRLGHRDRQDAVLGVSRQVAESGTGCCHRDVGAGGGQRHDQKMGCCHLVGDAA